MVPRLTPYGYAFYRAGFRLPANQLKPVAPDRMVSFISELTVAKGGGINNSDLSLPEVDVALATPIDKRLSMLARYILATDSSSQSAFDELWVQYNSAAKGPYWSLRVGQLPLVSGYQLLGDRTITLTDAMLFGPNGPLTGAAQGNFAVGNLERGAELGYTNAGFYVRASWLQGVDESGNGTVPPQGGRYNDFDIQTEYLFGNEGSALGAFYYHGLTPLPSVGYNNPFDRAGIFGTYSRYLGNVNRGVPDWQWEVNGGLLWGSDRINIAGRDASSYGALVEADFTIRHRTAFVARYDTARASSETGTPTASAWTFAIRHRANNYFQFGGEYRKQHDPSDDTFIGSVLFTY